MARKILLVDDDNDLLDALALTLRDFDVEKESDSCNALERLKTGSYAAVVSDVRMPVMEGPELLRKAMIEAPDTIRLMLTGHGDLGIAMQAINNSGIFRFLQKPVEPQEIRKALSDALAEHERQAMHSTYKKRALHDELTGLPNRSLFSEHSRTALARAARFNTYVAVMYLDIDGFKDINDTHGHDAGDKVLKVTADRIRSRLRENDIAARFGGDEFVIMLPDMQRPRDSLIVANDLVELIFGPISWKGQRLKVSASIGIAFYPGNGNTIEDVMETADKTMYQAKNKGGNRVGIVEMAECIDNPSA